MVARIGTWLFYAIVFFLLGIWSSSHLKPVGAYLDKGVAEVRRVVVSAWGGTSRQAATSDPATPAPVSLETARAAFARGDLNASIAAYRAVLDANPDDVEARGELGNVYFNAGRTDEATTTFYDTALRLIAKGQPDAARALIPAVRRSQPALGADLDRHLKGAVATSPPSANP